MIRTSHSFSCFASLRCSLCLTPILFHRKHEVYPFSHKYNTKSLPGSLATKQPLCHHLTSFHSPPVSQAFRRSDQEMQKEIWLASVWLVAFGSAQSMNLSDLFNTLDILFGFASAAELGRNLSSICGQTLIDAVVVLDRSDSLASAQFASVLAHLSLHPWHDTCGRLGRVRREDELGSCSCGGWRAAWVRLARDCLDYDWRW